MSKGLDAFEILKQDIGKCYEDEMLIVEKELKALEIIKDIFTLKEIVVNGKEHYCGLCDNRMHSEIPITKKEYDLLKEVLL